MVMTEEEASKKAEEWVDKNLTKTSGYTFGELKLIRLWAIDAYLRCFHDMTTGEPDGYISVTDVPFLFNKTWAEEARNRTFSLITYKDFNHSVPVKVLKVKQ